MPVSRSSVVPASFVQCDQNEHNDNPAHQRWLVGPDGRTWCEGALRKRLAMMVEGPDLAEPQVNGPLTRAQRDYEVEPSTQRGDAPEWARHLINPFTHDYFEDPVQVAGLDYDFSQLRELAIKLPEMVDPRSNEKLPQQIAARPNYALRDICAQLRGERTALSYAKPMVDTASLKNAVDALRSIEDKHSPLLVARYRAWQFAFNEVGEHLQDSVDEVRGSLDWWPDKATDTDMRLAQARINEAFLVLAVRHPDRLPNTFPLPLCSLWVSAVAAVGFAPDESYAGIAVVSILFPLVWFGGDSILRLASPTGGTRSEGLRKQLRLSQERASALLTANLIGSGLALSSHLALEKAEVACGRALSLGLWLGILALGAKVGTEAPVLRRPLLKGAGHRLVQHDLPGEQVSQAQHALTMADSVPA